MFRFAYAGVCVLVLVSTPVDAAETSATDYTTDLRKVPTPADIGGDAAVALYPDGRIVVRKGPPEMRRRRAEVEAEGDPVAVLNQISRIEARIGFVTDPALFAQAFPAHEMFGFTDYSGGGLGGPIVGGDDRGVIAQTTPLQEFPWRTVGALLKDGDGDGDPDPAPVCSGVKIGPRHVLTAAHCLYGDNGWYGTRWFAPGYAGGVSPNGAPRRQNSTAGQPGKYARVRNLESDYGILVLEDRPETAALGYMGVYWYADSDYAEKDVLLAGYPGATQMCSGSPRSDDLCGGFMYFDDCKIKENTDGYLMYDCYASKGHSGGPLWRYIDGHAAVLSIQKRGNEPPSGAVVTDSPATLNIGPRMRPSVYADICDWISQTPSEFGDHPCQ